MDPLEAHLRRQIKHSRDFFWHRIRWKAVAGEFCDDPFVLTDVGAGIGLVGDYLAADYPESTYRFVEPIDFLVAELEARFGTDANANRDATYAGSRYVTLLDVVEHIEDDHAFLTDLTAKMDIGATLILTVPARYSACGRSGTSRSGTFAATTRRWSARCSRGFRVREVSYLFPEMLPPALLRSRRRMRAAGAPDARDAEFRDLSRAVNTLLYALASGTLRLRRHWPAGTSILAIADRV